MPLEETMQLLTDKVFTNNWFNETYQLHLSGKVSGMKKQTVSLRDPYLVVYSLMRLCVALKKDWNRKVRCLHTTGDLLMTHWPLCQTKNLRRIVLKLSARVTPPLCSPWRLKSIVWFPSRAPSSSTDLHMRRPKSMSSSRTLASCCITRVT